MTGSLRPLRGRASRLPLRIRLVLGFSAAMLIVLTAAGGFVYWRVEYALDRGLDTDLMQATSTLTSLVAANGSVSDAAAAAATGAAYQILDESGAVLDHGGGAGPRPLVSRTVAQSAAEGAVSTSVGALLPAAAQPMRLEITSLPRATASPSLGAYLVVGVRRDHRDEALRELLLQLTLAGLGALLVTALVGERLARAALAPVEKYRRQAAEIADGASGLRLEVPAERDDEVTRLGHTLNTMLAELERALEHERRFVDDASHELRTPLTLLKSRVQLARRRPRTVSEHEAALAELSEDIERLNTLAEHLLSLGSAAAGASESSNVGQTVAALVERRRLADPSTAGELSVELSAHADVTVPLASIELERLVDNLLDNAFRHGAAPVELTVDTVAATSADGPSNGAYLLITVSDHGPGMDEALLASATGRFIRSADARARPGSGLGLSLVEVLVRRTDGELRLCHDGRHHSYGRAVRLACTHGDTMAVTVLLPAFRLVAGPP